MLLAMDNLSSLAFLLSFQILFNFALVSFAYEEKNNSYRMLLTMPISRADLVTSRYLSVYHGFHTSYSYCDRGSVPYGTDHPEH
jgi:ABC-type transport system involved in multi-copper enzyme maturation permease subunit